MDLGALVRRLVAGPSGAGGAAAPSGAGTASAPQPARDSLARAAWRDAPPLQRVVGSAPLVAPNAPFSARLATARPAPLALAPLGHDRGLEAPAGLVSGIAAPVQRSPSSPMPASVRTPGGRGARPGASAAVQRSAGAAWPDDIVAMDSPVADPAYAAVPAIDGPPDGGSAPAEAATPLMATSASHPAAPSSASPLVTAPSPTPELVGLIGRAAVASRADASARSAGASSSASAGPVAAAAPLVSRSLASEVGVSRTSGPSATADALGPAGTPSTPIGDRPVRRIRVGAALTPTVSRIAIPGSSATSSSSLAPTTAMASAEVAPSGGGSTTPGSSPSGPQAASADAANETIEHAARATAGPAATGSSPGPTPWSDSPALARLQRSVEPAAIRGPLVGGLRPVLTAANSAISVSRHVAAPEAAPDGEPTGAGSSADALAALGRPDWAADAGWAPSSPEAAGGGGAPYGTPGSPFAIESGQGGISPARLTWTNPLADPSTPSTPRDADANPWAAPASPSDAPGASPSGPSGAPTGAGDAASPAGAASSPGSARASAASSPSVSRSVASRTAAPRGGLRVGPAMTATLPGTLGRPAGQAPLRPSSPAAASSGPAGLTWAAAPVVARAVTIDELETTPDTTAASGETGAAASASAPAASAGSGGGGGGVASAVGAAGGAASEAARDQETQAMADRLYDRISLRLRRDLLVERERAGALVDRGF